MFIAIAFFFYIRISTAFAVVMHSSSSLSSESSSVVWTSISMRDRIEEGAPRSSGSTFRKRRGELGSLQSIPENCFVIPRIVFACAIFALPGLAWMRVCVCLRSVCGFWPGSEARRAAPSSGAPKHATKTSRDTEACFCLRYFCMSWPGLGAGMFALALEYRKASETRG